MPELKAKVGKKGKRQRTHRISFGGTKHVNEKPGLTYTKRRSLKRHAQVFAKANGLSLKKAIEKFDGINAKEIAVIRRGKEIARHRHVAHAALKVKSA